MIIIRAILGFEEEECILYNYVVVFFLFVFSIMHIQAWQSIEHDHLNKLSIPIQKYINVKIFYFQIKCCHGIQTKWPLLIKHINWVYR